jgi:cytochrome P450
MPTYSLPPGPPSKFWGLSFLSFRKDPIGFLTQAAQQYGDLVGFRFGPQWALFINHPDLIKDVLVTHDHLFGKGRGLQRAKRLLGEGLLTSEGSFHRRQRRLAQPAFHRQRVQGYGTVMTHYADQARQRWQEGRTLDIDLEMMRLTLAIVAKALFDADVTREAEAIGQALTTTMEWWRQLMLPFSELLEKLPLPSIRRFKEARARLDATIYRIIEERRADPRDRGDLLSMLMAAQDSEGDGTSMSDLQLRDELMTLFLAGHETTANVLTWTWYLLSQAPEVESRLHEELDRMLGGRLPQADDLPQLTYTEKVLAESMRLYPPAWIIGRRTLQEYEVSSYRLPPNTLILLSPFIMHRDARYYSDPEQFDPERWTPEAKAVRPRFSYFPFGGGSRQCIGESFAWMEGILLVATLAQRWRMRLLPGHPVAPRPLVTLRPKFGMKMTIERREDRCVSRET